MTQHDIDTTADMTRQDSDMITPMRVTVEEAAKILGVSVDAVRKRIERGTLESEKINGTRYVLLDARATSQDNNRTQPDVSQDADRTRHDSDTAALFASMQDQIDTLKRELEDRKEEAARKDAILLTMAQRLPELDAPLEAPGSTRTATGDTDEGNDVPSEERPPPTQRSFWARLFGLQ